MKYGFIGIGNMSSAIIKSIIDKGMIKAKYIYAYDLDVEKQKEFAQSTGINAMSSEKEVVNESDFVFLAVKPNTIETVIKEISEIVEIKKTTIVSIAAGKNIEFLKGCFGFEPSIIRVMPNVNALVGESMSALCKNDETSIEDFNIVMNIFNSIGKGIALKEENFSVFVGLAGSAPAYVYLFIDSIARAGVKAGLDKKTSLEIASQAVFGSAKMVSESDKHPWELIDMVCSPGGTTIEGIASLLNDAFEGVVIKAVEKVIAKDKML